jgi:hypothetical protein
MQSSNTHAALSSLRPFIAHGALCYQIVEPNGLQVRKLSYVQIAKETPSYEYTMGDLPIFFTGDAPIRLARAQAPN